jgi:COP9 signalosome complex subunit 7
MPTIRDLEDLIIDAIYLDILRGKLDQKEQQLEIEYTMGRDLEPGKIENVLAALKNWCVYVVACWFLTEFIDLMMLYYYTTRASTTSAVLSSLDVQLHSLASQSAANAVAAEEHEKAWQSTLKDIQEKQKERGGRKGLGGGSAYNMAVDRMNRDRDDPMDVDEPAASESKGKNRK